MSDKPISEILKATGLPPQPDYEMDGLMRELITTLGKSNEQRVAYSEPSIPGSMKEAPKANTQAMEQTHPTPLPSSGMREMGKLPVNLVPAEFNLLLSVILEYGAKKYAPHNFEKGMDPDDLMRGAESHLMAIKAGALYDPESGLPHAGHAAWNLLTFAMQMMREPSLEELFTSVVARRRAGNLTNITREYAAKHEFDFTATDPEFNATEWHERVALLRNMIKQR